MNQLLIGWIVQLLFALMVAGVGYSMPRFVLEKINWSQLIWLERLAAGAILVISILFFSGALIAVVPYGLRQFFSFAVILLLLLGSFLGLKQGAWRDLATSSSKQRIVAGSTLILAMSALAMAWLPVRLPTELIDGPYVIKQDLPAVRVQHISGTLPIDNAIPHVATEYLLRDIKFSTERPLMPGQEVSNRPIMVSFLILPWHAIIEMPPQQHEPLARFSYVGQFWPDFSKLLESSNSWAVSIALGSILNSLLLLIVGAWMVRQPFITDRLVTLFSMLALSSPYVLVQTFYTWPKSLAGFFIIYGYLSILRGFPIWISAVALGLAYWSHPYAVVYFMFFAIWLYCRTDKDGEIKLKWSERNFIKFIMVYVIVVLPWFVWTRLIARIPSDLVAQNLLQNGQRWVDFLWVRMVNFYTTFAPLYLQTYPFDVNAIFRSVSVNFTGAVGLLPVFILLHRLCINDKKNYKDVLIPLLLPGAALVAIFSNLAVPALHGLQPLVLLGLAAAVAHLAYFERSRYFFILLVAQVLGNLIIICRYIGALLSN